MEKEYNPLDNSAFQFLSYSIHNNDFTFQTRQNKVYPTPVLNSVSELKLKIPKKMTYAQQQQASYMKK